MRCSLASLTFFILISRGAAQEGAGGDAISWRRFDSREARFSISFPGVPEVQKQTGAINFQVANAHWACAVSFLDLAVLGAAAGPEKVSTVLRDSDKVLNTMRDGAVRNLKLKVLDEKTIALKGSPGRELQAVRPPHFLRSRTYLVHDKIYTISVIGSREIILSSAADWFLNSFTVDAVPSDK